MLVSSSQAGPVIPAAGEDGKESAEDRLRADLARRVVAGPGLWTDWLEDIDRRGLIEELLADGVIEEAAASAPHDHQLDRALNAKMTVICLIVGCLFPGEGYDGALRVAFSLPGLGIKPGTPVPSGPALSKARALSGEHVMKRLFELDAARPDPEPGPGSLWRQMELTAIDGTTAELFSNDELADEFGVPSGGTKPEAEDRRACPYRDPPVDRRGGRRLPRRGEHRGRRACRHVQARNAEPRGPRVLLHEPVDPPVGHGRAPVLAGQERRRVRTVQDPPGPPRRVRAGPPA